MMVFYSFCSVFGWNMIKVYLPDDLEKQLILFALHTHKSKSEIIKDALEKMLVQEQSQQDSYTLGENYFGRYQSGDSIRSTTYKTRLKSKLPTKYDSH